MTIFFMAIDKHSKFELQFYETLFHRKGYWYMALGSDGWDVSITFLDNGGNKTTRTYETRATSAAEAATAATAALAAFGGATDCAISGYNIIQRFSEDALTYPASGVQIENQAEINVKLTTAANKFATINIPAPKITMFVQPAGPGANNVDLTDGAITPVFALFQSTAPTGFKLSDGETMEYAVVGKRIHRKSRNG